MGEANLSLATARELESETKVPARRLLQLVRTGVIPRGVAVHFGRQVRFARGPFLAWLASGGAQLPGGWRREAPKVQEAEART